MTLLLGVAFVAGVVTAVSPCVLPVLPIVFAGSAGGTTRRPYAVVAGLVASFTVFTLTAAALLRALGLPGDLLRTLAIAVVAVLALSLLSPRLGALLGRPFRALGRRQPGDVGGGFVLGLSLGVVFTPCAGPVIGAVATLAAAERFTADAFLVTLAYALGAGAVLLPAALAARRGLALRRLRAHAPALRRGLGALVAAAAVLMVIGVDKRLQTRVPEYTRALQGLELGSAARAELDELVGGRATLAESELSDFGLAPEFTGIEGWLNSEPLSLAALRGKVVVVDFWTYSCVNCLRTLPYLKRWHEAYQPAGLAIVGVHTPEFAFEHIPENVSRAVESLGIAYPVALDNEYATWNAWGNRYWPSKYFIDRRGHVRYAHFGEGDYEQSEEVIRALLAEEGLPTPVAGSLADETPSGPQTPESYLGWARLDRLFGSEVVPDVEEDYEIPASLPLHGLAYGGRWTVERERIVAGEGARLRLAYHARNVFLVLGAGEGGGTVEVAVDGRRLRTVHVDEHRLYTLVRGGGEAGDHRLDLSFSPGVQAYAFTFG